MTRGFLGLDRRGWPGTIAVAALIALIAVGLPVLVRYRIDWERVAPSVAVFAWAAGICVVLAAGFWWRAGRELDRGD